MLPAGADARDCPLPLASGRTGGRPRVQAGAGLRAAGRARVRAGGAPPPRGQSRPRESKGAVGDGPGLTRRRRVGLVVELAGCLPGVPTLRPATGTHGLLQLRQEAHTGASVMDGGLEAAPRMARLGRAPARDLGVAARGGIRAATGGGRCGFLPLFLAPFSVTRAAGGLFLCGARAAK